MLRIFGPLRRFGVPVDDIAMMISIALRFIPTTAREAQMIQLAQKARCANFDDGNLFVRLKAWYPCSFRSSCASSGVPDESCRCHGLHAAMRADDARA